MFKQQKLIACLFILSTAAPALALDAGVEGLRESSKAFSDVGKQVSPSVVFIQVEKTVESSRTPFSSPFGDDFFDRFFGQPFPDAPRQEPQPQRRAVSQGSGFVFSIVDRLFSDKAYIYLLITT